MIGISQNQQGVLNQLFGVGGSLPTLAAIQAISGLPSTGAFSGIDIGSTNPPQNQIGNLPFSGSYTAIEEQNLATNTESLRASVEALRVGTGAMQTQAEQMLNALATPSTGPVIVADVFVGLP